MKNLRKDFKFWVFGILLGLLSLVYMRLDSGSIQPQYIAESAKFLLDESKENESIKIIESDLIKKLSKAIFQLVVREQ